MFRVAKKWWAYLTARADRGFEAAADPSVQLDQAIREAEDQHRRLRDQAANVIAGQKQAELRLSKKMDELERLRTNARQALVMADDAARSGDAATTARYTDAAETIAAQLVVVEADVEDLKHMLLDATRASEQAKSAVEQNARTLRSHLNERHRLASRIEQTKMQEQLNAAIAQLEERVGDDVPTLAEVSDKIDARFAKARAVAELRQGGADDTLQEIERAAEHTEARVRLSSLRAELGLEQPPAVGSGPAPTVAGA